MENPENPSPISPLRPRFLTILCYLTLFASSYMMLSAVAGLSDPEELTKTLNKSMENWDMVFSQAMDADPKGKEGLTMLTASLLTEGSTKNYSTAALQKTMYPWAARMGSFVDKEVSIIGFECPTLYLNEFYALVKEVLLNPAFDSSDVERVRSNQKNFVDEVIRQSSDEEYGKKYLEYILFNSL